MVTFLLNSVLMVVFCFFQPSSSLCTSDLCGVGSSFAAEFFESTFRDFSSYYYRPNSISPLQLDYAPLGSGAGRRAMYGYNTGDYTFAASDAPLSAKELNLSFPNTVRTYPLIIGTLVIQFNKPALYIIQTKYNEHLTLKQDVLVDIFLGVITQWNDPRILASQPPNITAALQIDNSTFKVLVRNENTYWTNVLTRFFSKISAVWNTTYGVLDSFPKTFSYSRFDGDLLSSAIEVNTDGITYLPGSCVDKAVISLSAYIENFQGEFTFPNENSLQATVEGLTLDSNFLVSDPINLDLPGAYPLMYPTYLLVIQNNNYSFFNCTQRSYLIMYISFILKSVIVNQSNLKINCMVMNYNNRQLILNDLGTFVCGPTNLPSLVGAPVIAQCVGEWVPSLMVGGVSSLCSSCDMGISLFTRYVNTQDSLCISNGTLSIATFKYEACSFPCNTNNSVATLNAIANVLTDNNYFQSLLDAVNVPVQFNVSIVNIDTLEITFFPCNSTVNMTYLVSLLRVLMRDIFVDQNLPIFVFPNCKVQIGRVAIAKLPNPLLFTPLVVLVLVLVLICVLLYHYYSSDLHSLPKEISWSFIDQLTHPYRWKNRIEYHIREYKVNSFEFIKVKEMLNGCLEPVKIYAVYNPSLTTSFINQWQMFLKRKQESPEIFFSNNYSKNEHKVRINDEYERVCKQFEWNEFQEIPLLRVFHGTDFGVAGLISQTGFALLSSLDAGFYGKGIYFTTHLMYTLSYAVSKRNPAVIISYLNPGNVFPVTEAHKGPKSLVGASLMQGYNSHFVVTNRDGHLQEDNFCEGNPCDEVVVGQESQILPAFIILFDKEICEKKFHSWILGEDTNYGNNPLYVSFESTNNSQYFRSSTKKEHI